MAEIKQYVGFILGKEHYGVNIMSVEEIIQVADITPVPRAPSFVEGIINLRGRVIPIVDLRKRLRVTSSVAGTEHRIVVMNLSGRSLGFMVDKVEEVIRIDSSIIDKAPGMSPKSEMNYIEGVARLEKMVIILDIKNIFSSQEESAVSSLIDG